jgi:hypothetical protein
MLPNEKEGFAVESDAAGADELKLKEKDPAGGGAAFADVEAPNEKDEVGCEDGAGADDPNEN